MVHSSRSVREITINCNGLVLPKVTHILELVDHVRISLYRKSKMKLVEHPKVIYNPHPYFPNNEFPAPTPCICLCNGPISFKGLVFTDCGPPLFDAVKRMANGKALMSFGVEMAAHYADRPKRSGHFAECAYCWSNSNCSNSVEAHSTKNS